MEILDLTSKQTKGLEFAKKKAKLYEKETRHVVLTRLLELGFLQSDYDILKEYLKSLQVTVNIQTNVLLEKFTESSLIKNAFEVATNDARKTYLDWRNQKEGIMFGKAYEAAPSEEKVKYGALNIFNEKCQISCKTYGNTVITLKENIKKRITFVNGNSSVEHIYICTFLNCMHLLIHVNDEFIKELVKKAKNPEDKTKTNFPYIEAQIHGQINIDNDVEQIAIPSADYIKLIDRIGKFQLEHPAIKIVEY